MIAGRRRSIATCSRRSSSPTSGLYFQMTMCVNIRFRFLSEVKSKRFLSAAFKLGELFVEQRPRAAHVRLFRAYVSDREAQREDSVQLRVREEELARRVDRLHQTLVERFEA